MTFRRRVVTELRWPLAAVDKISISEVPSLIKFSMNTQVIGASVGLDFHTVATAPNVLKQQYLFFMSLLNMTVDFLSNACQVDILRRSFST